MADLEYWLWLTTRKGLGSVGALTVLDHFVTPERAYYAGKEDYALLPIPPFAQSSLLDKSMEEPDRILGECDRLSMRIMTFQDADYPQRLRQIGDPPAVLYIKGKTFRFDEEAAIAVVGARRPSQASRARAERFGMELAAAGALVVSGIAEGLDSFPVLRAREPGTPHKGEHFAPRNRILSGLSLGVLAVECAAAGGTMLTVGHALEQGREVYAVPIGLDERCARGTNALIRDRKAKLVEDARDILADLADLFPAKLASAAPLPRAVAEARSSPAPDKPREEPRARRGPGGAAQPELPRRELVPRDRQKSRFTDDELAILAAAAQSALTADEIVERTQIPAKRVLSALTMLQVQGAAEERPGRRFYALVELEP